jgi:hypothetical protein
MREILPRLLAIFPRYWLPTTHFGGTSWVRHRPTRITAYCQSWPKSCYCCFSVLDCEGRTIWIVDAHPGDGKRFVVRADEKLSAFLELESAIRVLK